MIRNEREYQQAVTRIDEERARLDKHAAAWAEAGYSPAEIARLREPLESFHLQLREEVQSYERLKQGRFSELENLAAMGQTLIGLRIARGMTQRQLAEELGVSETQVSRDERNEYHGITLERAHRVLEALGVRLVTRVDSVEPFDPGAGRPGVASAPEPSVGA